MEIVRILCFTNLIVFYDEMIMDERKGSRMSVKRLLRPPPQYFK